MENNNFRWELRTFVATFAAVCFSQQFAAFNVRLLLEPRGAVGTRPREQHAPATEAVCAKLRPIYTEVSGSPAGGRTGSWMGYWWMGGVLFAHVLAHKEDDEEEEQRMAPPCT